MGRSTDPYGVSSPECGGDVGAVWSCCHAVCVVGGTRALDISILSCRKKAVLVRNGLSLKSRQRAILAAESPRVIAAHLAAESSDCLSFAHQIVHHDVSFVGCTCGEHKRRRSPQSVSRSNKFRKLNASIKQILKVSISKFECFNRTS